MKVKIILCLFYLSTAAQKVVRLGPAGPAWHGLVVAASGGSGGGGGGGGDGRDRGPFLAPYDHIA